MKQQLKELGYVQGYFPFNKEEIRKFETIAEKASALSTDERKNIFHHFPLVKERFERAIKESPFQLKLTDYCFYIEKNTYDRNWPLLFHKDINLPDYMNISNETKMDFLKNAIMFRLTLDTSDKDTGAIKVIPKSHLDELKTEDKVFIDTKEGEVIFFKPLLLHGSNKIKRPHTRRVFQALCVEVK